MPFKPPMADKPNVILVMSDDQGWTQTGYYGHPIAKTPNLDDMAQNGLRMDRFYASAPFCSPTRAAVLTGRTNDRTGVFVPGDAINKQESMLSTAFQKAGYSTGHFGKWHLNKATPDHPLRASNPHNPGELGFDYWLSISTQFNLNPVLSRNGVAEQLEGDGSEAIVDEALKFIAEETEKDNPVFVLVWYSTPHRIFDASEEDVAPYLDRTDKSSALQLGELAAMDRSIGTLRQGLRDLGIAENTLVWFTSDNGGLPDIDYRPDLPGVHPDSTGHLRGFKKDLYEGGIRVPTIIEFDPGRPEHHTRLDAAVRPRRGAGHRHGQHPGARVHRGTGVWDPCSARCGQRHRPHQARSVHYHQWRCRIGDATRGGDGSSPHFSPGAVMIAEDFGPVRVLATESIAGPTVEGACARTGPKDPRGHGQRSLQPARSLASRSTS